MNGAAAPGPIVIVAGPTASGKSALALALAEAFGGEIVNADSMQVYRELSILTARPSPAEEARVPHHLYGVLSAAEICSAGLWLEMAVPVIEAIRARGAVPVICGGTGLYLKVLMEGIAPVPKVADWLVGAARRLMDDLGAPGFHARLAAIDPEAAARLAPGDRQRLIRAYCVKMATGRTLSEWQAEQSADPALSARFLNIVLAPDREALYRRIGARFDTMLETAGLDEAAALRDLGLDPSLPAMKALGVPELLAHLDGTMDLDDAVERAKQLTRNFAKRQATWFRGQMAADLTFAGFGDAAVDAARSETEDFLRAGGA